MMQNTSEDNTQYLTYILQCKLNCSAYKSFIILSLFTNLFYKISKYMFFSVSFPMNSFSSVHAPWLKIYSFSGIVRKWSINHLICSFAPFVACRLPLLAVKSLTTAFDKKHLLVSASWDLTRLSMLQTLGLLPARLLKVLLYDSNWLLIFSFADFKLIS